jgi:hypothetical protein
VDIAHVQAIEAYEAEYRRRMVEIGEWTHHALRELGDKIGHDDMREYLNPYRPYSEPERFRAH